jgi:hypothetical protein
MTSAAESALGPTPEQARVIELPSGSKTVVLAGPGTGKTYTLLRRAAALVRDEGLEASELLVLSFTRAVVRELRLRDRVDDAPSRILPETFDSFASRLLREVAPDTRWEGRGFDGRIEAATRLLRDGTAGPVLAGVRHVLVDEVQDLVGVRARFVADLLGLHPGGWTAFGDPAQAIYDHERGRHDHEHLMQSLESVCDEQVLLTQNHRASGALAQAATELRIALLGDAPDAADRVWDAYRELETAGGIVALAAQLGAVRGTFAILCRDNATALQCSDALHLAGVPHRVRRGASDRPVAGWLGAVLRDRSTITREGCSEQIERLSAFSFPGTPPSEEAWRILALLDRNSRAGAVRVSEVASRLSVGRIPWALYDEPDHRVMVSSIHRAKGLEFDQCAIAEWRRAGEADERLEARVLYVALTRARFDCFHIAREQRQRWFRSRDAFDRFIKVGGERWQTFGIEVRGGDVHAVDPGGALAINAPAPRIQELLVAEVRPGDEVRLEYIDDVRFSGQELPCYAVRHTLGLVGVTGEEFGRALGRRVRSAGPRAISNVRVDDLETVRGSSDIGDTAGLGRSGIWLRPRLIGLGEFEWS